jgi:hypothetical protein
MRNDAEMIAGPIADAVGQFQFDVPRGRGLRIGACHRQQFAIDGDAHRPRTERGHERALSFAGNDFD